MRLHLTFAFLTVLLLAVTLPSHRHHFSFADVEKIAQQRAAAKYAPLPSALPPELQNLNPHQEDGIFWKEAYRLWRRNGLPFQVDFYHISKAFPSGPRINTVDRKGAHRLAYSPTFFNFSGLQFNPPLPASLPYAGFYLRYPLPVKLPPGSDNKPNMLNGFFSALGGNYFRVLARDQVYGLSARALAIDTALGKPAEEFPQFTDWWLYQPAPDATQLVLNAVIDSPSVAGAYEFKIRPGAPTAIDIRATLFFRQPVARLGIAPFSSMYLFGENAKNHFGFNVPEIHDSDGMVFHSGKDTWLWRPLQQASFLQIYNFADENPRGFGLVQRDREFQHYQDLVANYNVRPSVWVTPHGNWGKGALQLTELVTNNTNTDNVVLFWRPDVLPKAGDRLELNYTVEFYMNDATRPPLASCESTFINDPAPPAPPPPPASPGTLVGPPAPSKLPAASSSAKTAAPVPPKKIAAPAPVPTTTPVQFLVDFKGNGIENIPPGTPPDIDLSANPPGTVVRESKVEKNGYDNSWRITFTIIPFKKHVPTELQCRLFPHDSVSRLQNDLNQVQTQIEAAKAADQQNGVANLTNNVLPQKEKALQQAQARPLTETWTYTWHQ